MFERDYYKPFDFPWAYDYFRLQQKMHWDFDEVPMSSDTKDWAVNLTNEEKDFLTNIFRFFTQAGVDVAAGYCDNFLPNYRAPELRMMMSAFANMEGTHIAAYSLLIDTVGMPESEYKAFKDYKEMVDKHEYLYKFQKDESNKEQTLKNLAVYSAFTEGLQLFASFAMLLNFQRFNKMKGMCQIVAWSVRDETLHVEGMTRLFRELHSLWEEDINVDLLESEIRVICHKMIELEDAFIDLVFKEYCLEGLDKEDMHSYIRYIANVRMKQLGYDVVYPEIDKNPIAWVDELISGHEHTNFFENRATAYAKASSSGNWEEVWNKL